MAVFEHSTDRDLLNSTLAAGLEALSVKADAQVEYWRNKQNEYPALDEFLDEDGILDLPEEISPILSQSSANGSYSEADWWRSTIRGIIAAVNETSVARGPLHRLKTFANEIIDLAAEDDAPDGGSIHRRAVELGLLHENKSVTATGGVVDYRRDDVLHTFGSAYRADVDPPSVVGIDRIRDAISSLEASGAGLAVAGLRCRSEGRSGRAAGFQEAGREHVSVFLSRGGVPSAQTGGMEAVGGDGKLSRVAFALCRFAALAGIR